MAHFTDKIDQIKDKNDFLVFLESMTNDLRHFPSTWENRDLVTFLDAMSSWVEVMENNYANRNLPIPENINWKVFADILAAASMYE